MFDFQLILSYTVFWTTRDLKSSSETILKLLKESGNSSLLLSAILASGDIMIKYGCMWLVWIRGNYELKISRFVETPWHQNMGVARSYLEAPAWVEWKFYFFTIRIINNNNN